MTNNAEVVRTLYYARQYEQAVEEARKAVEELKDHIIIGVDGPLARLGVIAWFANASKGATVRNVCTTVGNLISAVRAGTGVGLLPLPLGNDCDLIECFDIPQFNYGYYLVTREALKDVPRVKAFNEFIVGRATVLKHIVEVHGRSDVPGRGVQDQ